MLFSVPTATIDRPVRGPEMVPECGMVGLRGHPARRSKYKMLDRFRAVGAIEFRHAIEHTDSRRNMRRYIRTAPLVFFFFSI